MLPKYVLKFGCLIFLSLLSGILLLALAYQIISYNFNIVPWDSGNLFRILSSGMLFLGLVSVAKTSKEI